MSAPQMVIDGVAYVEAPEADRFGGGCFGCAMSPIFSSACLTSSKTAIAAFGGECTDRHIIYIRATEAPEASAQPDALRAPDEPTALWVADALEFYSPLRPGALSDDAARLLREQHALIQEMLAALNEYANPLNWSADGAGIRRVWLEPGSATPDAYNGFESARNAIKKVEAHK